MRVMGTVHAITSTDFVIINIYNVLARCFQAATKVNVQQNRMANETSINDVFEQWVVA